MKSLTLILPIVLCFSCSNKATHSTNDSEQTIIVNEDTEALDKALALAINKKDYRLLATTTRGINMPGVNSSDYQRMIKLCGKKYHISTGDVITSENQRMERKKTINYMRQYNMKMSLICMEVNKS